jgi:hypothetical protein
MSNYTSAAHVAHNRNVDTLPTRDMDGSTFHDEPTAEEIASYERWQANGGANYPPTAEDMEADDTAQNPADAIVRLAGLDTHVADDEFDPEVGRKYFLGDGNVFIVRRDGTVALTDTEGKPTTALYGSSAQIAAHVFKVVGEDQGLVDMYQHGQYIASEPITA